VRYQRRLHETALPEVQAFSGAFGGTGAFYHGFNAETIIHVHFRGNADLIYQGWRLVCSPPVLPFLLAQSCNSAAA